MSAPLPDPTDGSLEAVVVHFRTPDLLDAAVRSFAAACPGVPLRVLDNGSHDPASDAVLDALARDLPAVTVERLPANLYHGPAMAHALATTTARAVFFLDSDTVTRRGGFLGPMRATLHEGAVAVGELAHADRRGFAVPPSHPAAVPVPVSWFVLVDVAKARQLPPFVHHGLPVLAAMRAAKARGWTVEPFPVSDFVDHLGRGTAARHGYGLGWRSRLDYVLHRLGL